MTDALTPQLLLAAYAQGCFPMAESRESNDVLWFRPEQRGVIPLDSFHIPSRLARSLRAKPFEITVDRAFTEVMAACAERAETWINDAILRGYLELHRLGFAHSVECWRGGRLVGGLYGVALGAAFFGESMFSRETNASKAALVYLVERLKARGYVLLDTQYVNEHLTQFGVIEIPRAEYMEKLSAALAVEPKQRFN